MHTAYLSALSPAVVLLLGAGIMLIVLPRLPVRWQMHPTVQYFSVPAVVTLAGLLLVSAFSRSTPERALSAWNFSAEGSGASLIFHLNPTHLPFFILTFLILLTAALFSLPLQHDQGHGWTLVAGATVWPVLAAANTLTLSYAILTFDLLLALYWLTRQQPGLAVARLFLGLFTASALALLTTSASTNLLGLALWLRLGLYPFIEVTPAEQQYTAHSRLVYLGLSLTIGLYLAANSVLPPLAGWLAVFIILFNSFLIWLHEKELRSTLLSRLSLSLVWLPLLLPQPLPMATAAYTLGLVLSLIVLWVTPALGQPRRPNIGRFWPYLPAGAATLTLAGLPLTLTWPVWTAFYQTPFTPQLIIVMASQILALSGLVHYWRLALWQNPPQTDPPVSPLAAAAGVVAAVPFLIPGLAPAILFPKLLTEAPLGLTFIIVIVIIMGALGLGYFKTLIISRLNLPVARLTPITQLNLCYWGEKSLSHTGKLVLRANAILEGQHYLGWAFFVALVGGLILLLQ